MGRIFAEREGVVKRDVSWDTKGMRVGIKTVSELPEKLRGELVKPPITRLYYRGKWQNEIFSKCVAIVGSRRMSRYGRSVIEEYVPRFCSAGYTIVSGLMYGVDQLVHKETLKCGGRAIAVLGYGINRKNEEEADKLGKEIEESGGLILSEYPNETRGQTWTFPQRNRIVGGLSDFVVVVEAGIKSGSLNTASWANRMGKSVYALPGSVFSVTSEGTNELINLGLAKPLTLKVMEELAGSEGKRKQKNIVKTLGAGERELYQQLELLGPKSVNELSRGLNLTAREILPQLSQMELKGIVTEERGVWSVYSRD